MSYESFTTLDKEGNVENYEQRYDPWTSVGSSVGQAQQNPLAALENILAAPFQLANNVLAGINNSVGRTGQAPSFPLLFPHEFINSNVVGQTGQAVPFKFPPLPSPFELGAKLGLPGLPPIGDQATIGAIPPPLKPLLSPEVLPLPLGEPETAEPVGAVSPQSDEVEIF